MGIRNDAAHTTARRSSRATYRFERAETREAEGYCVGAGTQVDNVVSSFASVATERTFSINAGLEASTVTRGTTALDASLTRPAIPLACFAEASGTTANNPREMTR